VDTRRLGIAIVVALVLSLGVTGLFYVRFARQQAANRPKTVRVFAAAKDIQAGVPVAVTSLKSMDWPNTLAVQEMVTKQEDVVGHVLIASIPANEPIFQHDIVSPGNSGLSARIPDGLRAVAVKTNEVNNLAGFLFPGSRVDVLATLRGENNKSYNRTVLQNVQVLSAGEKIVADPNGKPENVKIVTVLVTPEESQKLALAMEQGTIQLALRNQSDAQKVEPVTLSMSDLEGLPPRPVQHTTVTPKGIVSPKAISVYAVETIAGAKSSVAKFADGTAR
jgi:pilus assembly protein CpaB